MSEQNWTKHLDRAMDAHRAVIAPLFWGNVEVDSDRSLALSLNAADNLVALFESSSAVQSVKISVENEQQYDDEGGYYDSFSLSGEIQFRIDGERIESLELDSYVVGSFEGFLDEMRESGLDESHPVFSEQLSTFIEELGSDIDNNESPFMDKDFNDSVMNSDSVELTREEIESVRIDGVVDPILLLGVLRGKGQFISHLPAQDVMRDGVLDFAHPRSVWTASTLRYMQKHLDAGMSADAVDGRGVSAVLASAHFGDLPALKALLAAGADAQVTAPSGLDLLGTALLGRAPTLLVPYLVEHVGVTDGPRHARNLLLAATLGARGDGQAVELMNCMLAAGADMEVRLANGKPFSEGAGDFLYQRHCDAVLEYLASIRSNEAIVDAFSGGGAPAPKRSASLAL